MLIPYGRLAPRADDEENRARVRRLYDGLSDGYSRVRSGRGGGFLRWLAERDERALLALLAPRPGLRLLDVGCGDGRHGAHLRALGLQVWGVDFAPRMVAQAAARLDRAILGDIEDLALGARFDRILCAGALEFLRDPAAAVAGLARHLAPGGRLVVQAPCRSAAALPYALWQRLKNDVRVHLLDWRPLDAAARREGLALLARSRPFLHTVALCWERPVAP